MGGVHFWSTQICNNINGGGRGGYQSLDLDWGGEGVHFWSTQICNNINGGGTNLDLNFKKSRSR